MTTLAVTISGNRCGHNPLCPDLRTPDRCERLPYLITATIERIERYYDSPSLITSLEHVHSDRRQRSERREACVRMIKALLKYTDVVTLRVGIQTAKEFRPVKMSLLAREAGLHIRRAERAMHDLVRAGLVNVHRRCERASDGLIRGLAAVRTISKHLWTLLRLDRKLAKARKALSDKQRKSGVTKRDRAVAALAARSALGGLKFRPVRVSQTGRLKSDAEFEAERRRQLAALKELMSKKSMLHE